MTIKVNLAKAERIVSVLKECGYTNSSYTESDKDSYYIFAGQKEGGSDYVYIKYHSGYGFILSLYANTVSNNELKDFTAELFQAQMMMNQLNNILNSGL